MKKIFLIIIIIIIPLGINAQFTGTGTFSDPYSGGTLTGNQTWLLTSSPIYVSGDLTIGTSSSAGHLTIQAGVTIRFCATGADLIVTGLGELTADGTPSSQIRFTADTDKDGIYGETGETWGHISFKNMTTLNSSIIDNCIIEYGYKYTGTYEPESIGGGIYTEFSSLTISNSIIRNNYSGWGGGIYIFNASPSILNCTISNNTGVVTGGGCVFYNNCASIVENTIFEKNTSNGGGGGGGVFVGGNLLGNIQFYNCVIASNIGSNGANIRFFSSTSLTRPKFYNSIIWGSDNSIAYYDYTADATDFNYCAIQGYSSGYTNCININSNNTATTGPNFNNPSGGDYSINLYSPCRDAGTSSGAPALDILGNGRIAGYDIGAYEIQYSGWKTTATSTDWGTASNWDGGIPTSSVDVLIPSGASYYPTGSSSQNFTIGTGKLMLLKPGAQVTLGTLTNDGTLKLQSDATNISSLIINNSGVTALVELFLTGGEAGSKNYRWHYISTPVSTLAVSTFTSATQDIVRYWDSRVTGTNTTVGWVAQDGWIYATSTYDYSKTFTTLSPGIGYDYWDNIDNKFTFSGQLNISDAPMALDFYNGNVTYNGFNLLGNPFSSGLDWNYIITHSFPDNTSKSLYFTRDNALCSYIAGVGSPSGVNGYIPPMQGFFTKTTSTGNTIALTAAARTHTLHARYKGTVIIPLIRLSLSDDPLSDETVVRFDEKALPVLDNDFDAVKIFYSGDNTAIYSEVSGTKYVINGQPYPETFVEIPIGVNLMASGNHSITTTQFEGLDNYKAELIDNITGFSANLKTTPVLSFSASAGAIPDRFVLKITNLLTAIETPSTPKGMFNIYQGFDFINIQTLADDWDGKMGSIKVLDLAGKTITDKSNIEFSRNSVIQVQSPSANGIYLVEMRSGLNRYVGKVVIK
jgi:hypothetical protein